MKGRLNKLSKGWVVEYVLPGPPFVGELPLLMDEETSPTDRELLVVGSEVRFEQVLVLNDSATYTTEDGWNGDPIKGEYAKIIPEEKVEEPYDYWKERCLAAEKFIDLSPCDPDIYDDQLIAHGEWVTIKNKQTN